MDVSPFEPKGDIKTYNKIVVLIYYADKNIKGIQTDVSSVQTKAIILKYFYCDFKTDHQYSISADAVETIIRLSTIDLGCNTIFRHSQNAACNVNC